MLGLIVLGVVFIVTAVAVVLGVMITKSAERYEKEQGS
jgi:hypothetical protein